MNTGRVRRRLGVVTDRQDRNLDWRQELSRIAAELEELPPAAQRAVLATVRRFLEEDALRLPAPGRVGIAA